MVKTRKKHHPFYTILGLIILVVIFLFFFEKEEPEPEPVIAREEINITIIPGWNLSQVAESWVEVGLTSKTSDVFEILGSPEFEKNYTIERLEDLEKDYPLLAEKPSGTTYEGYIMPETYRVYKDADIRTEVLPKIFDYLESQITEEMREEYESQGRTFYEVLTMASIVEREAQTLEDMKMVADIFWRRLDMNWALQSCATVNYITGKNLPAVTAEDKEIDSPYNTYMYPGLTPGPIGNPSLNAIYATIYPTENQYWYFMSGTDGTMHYGRTLDEHNTNVYKYLR